MIHLREAQALYGHIVEVVMRLPIPGNEYVEYYDISCLSKKTDGCLFVGGGEVAKENWFILFDSNHSFMSSEDGFHTLKGLHPKLGPFYLVLHGSEYGLEDVKTNGDGYG